MKYLLLVIFFITGYNATSQCLVNSLIVNTGYNPLTGQAIPPDPDGTTPVPDPHWTVTAESPGIAAAIAGTGYTEVTPGGSADVITPFAPPWTVNPAGDPGGWISCLNATAYTTDGTGPNGTAYNMSFSRSFRLCSDDSIKLNMYMANDNYISAGDVDGVPITGFPTSIYANSFASFTNYTQTFYLIAGTHTINITVVNYNDVFPETNWTGLDIYGTVSSVAGLNSLVNESNTICTAYTCNVNCNSVGLADSLHACPGSTITLPGTLTGTDSVLSIAWSPPTGLSDTSILTPTLTVGNASAQYTLTVQSLIPSSNVANGDFSDGNTEFTSAYPYHPPPSSVVPEGDYTVSTNPFIVQSNFTSFGDHTTGTGNMMIMNGGPVPTDVWGEVIPVTPNTNYDFSAWIANCSSESVGANVPIMQFKINGVLIGTPTTISAAPGTWVNFFSTWNSGSSTIATINVYDANTSSAGNDFALDDISFNQICVATDSVYVQNAATSTTSTNLIKACFKNSVTIYGDDSGTNFLWDNNNSTNSFIVADSPGNYIVHYHTAPCVYHTDTFVVSFAPLPATGSLVGCPGGHDGKAWVQPIAGDSTTYTYTWTDTAGNLLQPAVTSSIVADTLYGQGPGAYTITIHSSGGCDTSLSVTIVPYLFAPTSGYVGSCPGEHNGRAWVQPRSGDAAIYTYTWTDRFGDLLQPAVTSSVIADTLYNQAPGIYTVTMQTANGCDTALSVAISTVDTGFLHASDTGMCPRDTITINVTGGISYHWQRDDKTYISDTTMADPRVSPKTNWNYIVYGINNSGCLDTTAAHVRVFPDAVIHLPDSVILYYGESFQFNPGTNCLSFSWFPLLGLSADNISNPIASPPVDTKYIVTGTTEEGCTVKDSVNVYRSDVVLLTLPNAFAPGNGPNSLFKPIHEGDITLDYLRIFNRWGQMVYESSDLNQGWDGTWHDTPQPEGVFVYLMQGHTATGRILSKQGNVTLLR